MAKRSGKVGANSDLDSMLGVKDSMFSVSADPIENEIKKITQLLEGSRKVSAKKLIEYEKALRKKADKEKLKEQKKAAQQINDLTATGFKKVAKNFGKALVDGVNKAVAKLGSGINQYIATYTSYMGKVTTRLQGTGKTFQQLASDVNRNLGLSPYLTQADMLNNLNKFVESGVAYNLESRAFIATATDKIAATFDAFDSSILRLIRLQQADTTVARIGMESLLTKFLNAKYEDTSYLTKGGLADNVTSALLEAESLMGYRRSTEFEYAVQQWLGSMSSLGVSDSAINLIAQGLGYLGSGNISAIAGNTSLQNLLVMAASRSGLSYGELLTRGMSASNASELLNAIVGLGQDIAESGNNVVMSQYASIFGLNVSDLISLTNITTQDLKDITNNIVSYEQMRRETTNQLATISERTTISEMMSNVLTNVMTGLGANIATTPWMYMAWQAGELMETLGLNPKINLGFLGTGTSTDLSTITKGVVIGASAITSMVSAIGNLTSGNGLAGTNLSQWGEVQTRGSGLVSQGGISKGVSKSGSSYIGALDSEVMQESTRTMQSETMSYVGEEQTETDQLTSILDVLNTAISPNVIIIAEYLTDTLDSKLNNITDKFDDLASLYRGVW